MQKICIAKFSRENMAISTNLIVFEYLFVLTIERVAICIDCVSCKKVDRSKHRYDLCLLWIMDEKMDGSTNESSQDGSTNDQIISGIAAPPVERETVSASNDTDQEKSTSCIRLSSCFTTDDRSDQNESLAGTSSKMKLECKYFDLFYLKKLVLLFSEQFMSSNPCWTID